MSNLIKIFTIGFTRKTAREFFTLLRRPDLTRVLDTRLNNVSQLAGFAKREDLRFFLREIAGIDYIHLPLLAPTQHMLDDYRNNGADWDLYQRRFLDLMLERRIETQIEPSLLAGACLLCSEPTPHHCHRRLVAEYLHDRWGNLAIEHL